MRKARIVAMALIICLLLSGCGQSVAVHAPAYLQRDKAAQGGPVEVQEDLFPEQSPVIVRSGVAFSDMTYKRPNTVQLIADLNILYTRFFKADSANERQDIVVEVNELVLQFMTMYALADIRNAMDVTNEFYADELAVLVEARNAVSACSRSFYERLLLPENAKLAEELLEDWELEDLTIGVRTGSEDTTALRDTEEALVLEYQQAIADLGSVVSVEEFCERYYDDWSALFLKLCDVRTELAGRLGYDSFVGLGYDRMGRTAYDVEDVAAFREAVKTHLVPAYQALIDKTAADYEYDVLPFYMLDYLVPTPSIELDYVDTLATFGDIYGEMSDETNECIDYMYACSLYDLKPTDTKYPGGFQEYIYGYASPFMFGNFYGNASDVSLFSHEFGHFFAAFRKINPDPANYCDADRTMDIREIQSSGMELLTMRWYDRFFRADADAFEKAGVVELFGLIIDCCMYDEWQHEVYANYSSIAASENPAAELDAILKRLRQEYYGALDYTYLEPYGEGKMWIEKSHLFETPFYMIDYALAYSVSLQIYNIARTDWDRAYEVYMAAMDCPVGSNFLDVVAAAGLKNPFDESSVRALARLLNAVAL